MNKSATHDLSLLKENSYWGRGIMIGNTQDKIAVAYFIMGRSENSRNRIFYTEGTNLVIAPHDESKVEDPSLIIYYPIKLVGSRLVVTNGDQTDTIEEFLKEGKSFEDALKTREFEPDAPHFTSRISGMVDALKGEYKLHILKNVDGKGERCGRFCFDYPKMPGFAHFIHTYEGNAQVLPAFEGEPWKIAIPDDLDEFTETIWSSLDDDNKISLCTIMIDPKTNSYDLRIKNKRMGD